MRRRQYLAAALGTGSLLAARGPGTARGTLQRSTAFEPSGTAALDGLKELVLGPDGDTAFAAVTDGFATVDVSDPADPTVLAERRDLLADREGGPMTQLYDAKVDGDMAVVVGPANFQLSVPNGAVFFDVSDPSDPERVGVYETTYPVHNCDFDDGVAYLTANGRSRSVLVMVSAGADPQLLGSWSIGDHDSTWRDVPMTIRPLHDVYVQDGVAYLAHWDAGTWIVDVSDPSAPSLVTRVSGRPASELADMGMQAALVEAREPPGNSHFVAVDEDASLLGIGRESWSVDGRGRGGPSGIDIWDVSTPTEPTPLSTIAPPPTSDPSYGGVWTTSHNFQFAGDRLYTSWYRGGVRVYDVADPANPTPIGAWRSTDEASFWTAQFTGSHVVAASGEDESGGPTIPDRVYTFPDPDGSPISAPTWSGSPTPDTDGRTTPEPGSTRSPTRGSGPRGDTATTQPTAEGSETPSDTDEHTATDGPGFGVLAGLAGLGLGAWWRRSR